MNDKINEDLKSALKKELKIPIRKIEVKNECTN